MFNVTVARRIVANTSPALSGTLHLRNTRMLAFDGLVVWAAEVHVFRVPCPPGADKGPPSSKFILCSRWPR